MSSEPENMNDPDQDQELAISSAAEKDLVEKNENVVSKY